MLNVHDIAQFHRRAGAPALPADTVVSLAAGIEHLVWQKGDPVQADVLRPRGALWDMLHATGWPAACARPQDQGDIGTYIMPVQENLAFLRDVEMTLRERMTAAGFTPMTAKALTGALTEIITNVWLHAQTITPALRMGA